MSGRNEDRVFLGLGGNLGRPGETMAAALRTLDARGDVTVVAVSPLYRTPPWGRLDQPDFINACAEIRTGVSPRRLLGICLGIERELKRVRRERWGPRAIDIDILVFGDAKIHEKGLEIPHPRIAERAFVLVPLADLAPELEIGGHTVADLLGRVAAEEITRLTPDGGWWRAEASAQDGSKKA